MGKIPLATKMSTPHNIIFYLFCNYPILQNKNLNKLTWQPLSTNLDIGILKFYSYSSGH